MKPEAPLRPDPVLPGEGSPEVPGADMPWVQVAPGAPYFVLEDGAPWTPIGQNDAVGWPELQGLFRRRDLGAVERHLRRLKAHGVTCLRLMLEYAQGDHRFVENPVGRFRPNMVQLWDDLFGLCARHGLRILLTPFDTFWTWVRWRKHPYNALNGGPCRDLRRFLLERPTIEAVKNRLTFAVERWGGSGALFAWDLWNEIHPAYAGNSVEPFPAFIAELSDHVRSLELRLYGRSHPQTVSIFGPVLDTHPAAADAIFRHPGLDFASTHMYAEGTIDHPRNTVDPAVRAGELVAEALRHLPPGRPFLDSEHGPIHTFKDRRRVLPEAFDDEYFRHIQWAHLASGGAGGGMRWPNRRPHVLTPGMRRAQATMAEFLPLIDWPRFRRRNVTARVGLSSPSFAAFACADGGQAVAWLLRRDTLIDRGRIVSPRAKPVGATLTLPGLQDGAYEAVPWSSVHGRAGEAVAARAAGGALALDVPPTIMDVGLAIRRKA